MVIKVISGEQTGADQAGLRAAKACGIATGGMMPKGFRTLDGPDKALAEEFGLREHTSPSYNMRTSANARDSKFGAKCWPIVDSIIQRGEI